MIDIEHGALGAFEDDRLTLGQGAVQEKRGVTDKGTQLLGGVGVFGKHFVGIKRVGIEEGVRDGIFFAAGILDMGTQQRSVEEIGDAKAPASHFVFVGGADAARSGADFYAAWSVFRAELHHAVVGQNDLCAVGDEEVAIDFYSRGAEGGDFFQEGDRVDDDSVADDADALGAQDAARDELKNKFLAVDDDGVSGVMAAGVTRDYGESFGEYVDNFPFALVAPLGSHDDRSSASVASAQFKLQVEYARL